MTVGLSFLGVESENMRTLRKESLDALQLKSFVNL